MSWTQPICIACWPAWIIGHNGIYRDPVTVAAASEEDCENCAFCGEDTADGIYVRADPSQVPNPVERD